jgi:Tfp pilus assembly protein PilF
MSPSQTARAYLTLGGCQFQLDQTEAAAESFRLAVEFDPELLCPAISRLRLWLVSMN